MHNLVDRSFIYSSLEKLGIKKNDNVLVLSDLLKLSVLNNNMNIQKLSEDFYETIKCIIGTQGTIIVPTYTNSVGRHGKKFEYEKTKSETGFFSEFIRLKKESIRSLHPINSFSSNGKNAELICANNSFNNFGLGSPLNKFHRMGGKILSIGLPAGFSLGITHYLEAMFCVPYIYNKILDCDVYYKGKKIHRVFTSSVRFLHLQIDLDYTKWISSLDKENKITGCEIGRTKMFLTNVHESYNIAAKYLTDNPFFLLKRKPHFKLGDLPRDGITNSRDAKAPSQNLNRVNSVKIEERIISKSLNK